jgi:endoglucanase
MVLNPSIKKQIGMYDPEGLFSNEKDITITADYFAWNKNLNRITAELDKVNKDQKTFLITIEPWPKPEGYKYESNDDLLKAIIDKKYDGEINNICSTLASSTVPIYIRWGHEMELSNSRYPWSSGNPDLYIGAYQHFVDTCRVKDASFKFVWSPAGEAGLEKYWPGDKYVDIIGLSIYSFDEYDMRHVGHKRSFKEVFEARYNRVKIYNKPILIAEMGVTGSDAYKMEWLGAMFKEMNDYKKLIGFVYLNTIDPQAQWEDGLSNPDWRLPKQITSLFPQK